MGRQEENRWHLAMSSNYDTFLLETPVPIHLLRDDKYLPQVLLINFYGGKLMHGTSH